MPLSRAVTLLVLTGAWYPGLMFAQLDPGYTPQGDESDAMVFDPLAFAGSRPGVSRLDVYVRVSYNALTFVKQGDLYDASFEITLGVADSSGLPVTEKSWTESLKGVTFDRSVSPSASDLLRNSFELPPAKYKLSILIRDKESKVERRASVLYVVPDFFLNDIAISDIMLLNRLTVEGQTKSIIPNVSSNIGELPEGFYIFSEIYNRGKLDSARIVARILSNAGVVLYQTDTVTHVSRDRNDVFVHLTPRNLSLGDYILSQNVYALHPPPASGDSVVARRLHSVSVRWKGLPRSLKEIDEAIDQVQYIAKEGELDSLKSATTLEEKQKRFLDFWRRRNPNPNAAHNEKMLEYYGRVTYANKHFTHYRPGWKTDMGMVFIVLGPPGSVDRHPFEIDSKPYEVWSYYDLNYQFIFVDESGYGDYRLITPFWEIYNRRRN